MKIKWIIILIGMLVFAQGTNAVIVKAETTNQNTSIEDMLNNLDTSDADDIINSLTQEQKEMFGAEFFKDKLIDLIKGNDGGFDNFLKYVFNSLSSVTKNMLPLLFSILGICVAFGIMNSFGNSTSTAVGTVIKFVFILLITITIFSQVMSVIINTKTFIEGIKKQIDVIFPMLMTMMAAIGTTKSVTVYQPAVAVLSSGLSQIVTTFVLPCFILSIVFQIASHFSDKVKLKNMSSFFSSSMKWLLGTAFFVFLSFLSIKGITASIYDNMYIRTTKFALNKYIPIIGGYLSEGYNLVFAGSIIIKNGVGLSAIILLVLSLLPLCFEILFFGLSLDLLAALSEPIGAGEAASIFKGLSKSLKNLLAIILGFSFLYFIFILLIICTGNLSL